MTGLITAADQSLLTGEKQRKRGEQKKTNKKTKHEEQTKDIFTSSLSAFRLIDSVGVNLKLPTRTGTR